jgi:hypothetical protein
VEKVESLAVATLFLLSSIRLAPKNANVRSVRFHINTAAIVEKQEDIMDVLAELINLRQRGASLT